MACNQIQINPTMSAVTSQRCLNEAFTYLLNVKLKHHPGLKGDEPMGIGRSYIPPGWEIPEDLEEQAEWVNNVWYNNNDE